MAELFDINLVRGAVLILLIVAFLGIWAWAWSKHRKPEFDAASRLPLEEDDGKLPSDADRCESKTEGSKE